MTDRLLISIIEKVRNGIEVERSGLDLKRKWWDFQKDSGVEEFLKDICAMANGQTGDSYIVIGVDEKGSLYDAPLPEDEANIQQRHKDKIEPRIHLMVDEYVIEGKHVSVITIPHSMNRPHVIKRYSNWRHWIPVRFGTSTLTASRLDLDEMYLERYKSHTADLRVRLFEEKIRWGRYKQYGGYCFMIRLLLDNYDGGAPDYIVNAKLHETRGNHWKSQFFMFEGLALNQELRVAAHDRKQGLPLYLSSSSPDQSQTNSKPTLDKKHVVLSLYARSGRKEDIEIEPSWLG